MKGVRECVHRYELDLQTLIWTRGRDFHIMQLASRLKCPRCGSRESRCVALLFHVPSELGSVKAARS
jgi:hypothetical protein